MKKKEELIDNIITGLMICLAIVSIVSAAMSWISYSFTQKLAIELNLLNNKVQALKNDFYQFEPSEPIESFGAYDSIDENNFNILKIEWNETAIIQITSDNETWQMPYNLRMSREHCFYVNRDDDFINWRCE